MAVGGVEADIVAPASGTRVVAQLRLQNLGGRPHLVLFYKQELAAGCLRGQEVGNDAVGWFGGRIACGEKPLALQLLLARKKLKLGEWGGTDATAEVLQDRKRGADVAVDQFGAEVFQRRNGGRRRIVGEKPDIEVILACDCLLERAKGLDRQALKY